MTEVQLSKVTVGLIERPSSTPRTRPPAAFTQSGPMSIAEAKVRSPFGLSEPTTLPAGFAPVDAMLLSGDVQMAILTYGSKAGRLTLVQAPSSQYLPGEDGQSRYYVVGESLRSLNLGEIPAAIAHIPAKVMGQPPSLNLVWERNGILNQLLGNGIDEEALSEVAVSIA